MQHNRKVVTEDLVGVHESHIGSHVVCISPDLVVQACTETHSVQNQLDSNI